MVYKSLTEAPHNLKEGIDWLIAVKGDDAANNLMAIGTAVHKFLADKPVGFAEVPALENVKRISKEFLGKPELKDQWPVNFMLRKFNQPMDKNPNIFVKIFGDVEESDYKNVIQDKSVSAETIAKDIGDVVNCCEQFLEKVKIPDQYKSAYSSEATWDASCAKDPESCAIILVGIAPMLYAGLNSLMASCIAAFFRGLNSKAHRPTQQLLQALGCIEPECRAGISVPNIIMALGGMDKSVMTTIYDLSGFWAFY
ncbi:hypothetical protein BBBOND_0404440 [Babesia bigemina]|uniref:Uncharacterized protein n=1 Tax=Babesia bigemina TaxID=5866 RepID=A0A061DB87_BABBI|nr:hypothetical protein BBBOND_0404440 [Babesia bigemina]CDR97956.1 hypothetical protein BBBOND_0404440 [Babesia bigemina]|eukprot:XP_012770142.1 hypothetical protein BBBOND_0404440 [Babesia bigemina]